MLSKPFLLVWRHFVLTVLQWLEVFSLADDVSQKVWPSHIIDI